MNHSLSIVTTCHPSKKVMDDFYEAVSNFSTKKKIYIELIVVHYFEPNDDASSLVSSSYITLKKIYSDSESGQAGSIVLGFMESGSSLILSIDPDMSSSLYAVDEMLTLVGKGYQVVMARRALKDRPFFRAMGTYVFNVVISGLLGFRVYDLNSPMFLVHADVVSELSAKRLQPESYKFRLFIDYRNRLIELFVRDHSSEMGEPSTYSPGMLASLFFKRILLLLKLRVQKK